MQPTTNASHQQDKQHSRGLFRKISIKVIEWIRKSLALGQNEVQFSFHCMCACLSVSVCTQITSTHLVEGNVNDNARCLTGCTYTFFFQSRVAKGSISFRQNFQAKIVNILMRREPFITKAAVQVLMQRLLLKKLFRRISYQLRTMQIRKIFHSLRTCLSLRL